MKIVFDGQPLADQHLTGIGIYTQNIIRNVLLLDDQHDYGINILDYSSIRTRNKVNPSIIKNTQGLNQNLKICKIVPAGVYVRFQGIFRFIPYELLFQGKADISHFFNSFIPMNIKGKKIVTVHDMVIKRFPETMKKNNYHIVNKNITRSCKAADAIVTVSNNSKQEISDYMGVDLDKIHVTYNAIDRTIYRPIEVTEPIKKKYRIDTPYILYVGTLEPRKNITRLIEAFQLVSSNNKGVKLVITGGKGWLFEEVFTTVKALNLEKQIIFTGYVPIEDLPALYSGALLFVFPSLYEGFGIPPLEAMACNTPVIVSNNSSLPEVVGDAGILIDPYDVEGLAEKIDLVIRDENLRLELSKAGLLQADKFSWQDSARKILELYKSI